MSASRRRFSREFKLEVIRRVQETGRIQTQIAEEQGISAKLPEPLVATKPTNL